MIIDKKKFSQIKIDAYVQVEILTDKKRFPQMITNKKRFSQMIINKKRFSQIKISACK